MRVLCVTAVATLVAKPSADRHQGEVQAPPSTRHMGDPPWPTHRSRLQVLWAVGGLHLAEARACLPGTALGLGPSHTSAF